MKLLSGLKKDTKAFILSVFTLFFVCGVVYAATTAQWLADGFFVSNAKVVAAKGSIPAGDGTRYIELVAGTNNSVLTADSTQTVGFRWGPASVRLAANYTNATAGFTNTALSVTVTTGRVYSFHCVLIYSNSTATEGAQFDFNGGAATSTNFVAGSEGGINDTVTTALTGVYSQATVTGNNITTIDGTFEPSSTGTFIVRGAEVSHTTGTLTVLRGSYLAVWDMP